MCAASPAPTVEITLDEANDIAHWFRGEAPFSLHAGEGCPDWPMADVGYVINGGPIFGCPIKVLEK